MSSERQNIIQLVDEARAAGARLRPACEIMGISVKTYQRWCAPDNPQDARIYARQSPPHKLSEAERQQLLAIANAPDYADLPTSKIVPKLADQGIYIASESTFYRVLKAEKQLAHR